MDPAPPPETPDGARLLADLAAAGLRLAPAEVPGVLDTARFLDRARGLVARYLETPPDDPR